GRPARVRGRVPRVTRRPDRDKTRTSPANRGVGPGRSVPGTCLAPAGTRIEGVTRLAAVAVLAAALWAGLVGESGASSPSRTVSIAWVGDIAMVASGDGGAGFFSA